MFVALGIKLTSNTKAATARDFQASRLDINISEIWF